MSEESLLPLYDAVDAGPRVVVVSLAGDTVGDFNYKDKALVINVKIELYRRRPDAHIFWQRLFLLEDGGRELQDGDQLAAVCGNAAEDGGESRPCVLQWLLSVEPCDIWRDDELERYEVATSFDAMGSKAVRHHLGRLFFDSEGDLLVGAAYLEVLLRFELLIGADARHLKSLQAALCHFAFQGLEGDGWCDLGRIPRRRFYRFLNWLASGKTLEHHIVTWITLMPRPLCAQGRRKVEELERRLTSPRVGLAAKVALADRGGEHVKRVKELATVRSAIGRSLATAPDSEERRCREEWMVRIADELRTLEAAAADCKVRYEVRRALR